MKSAFVMQTASEQRNVNKFHRLIIGTCTAGMQNFRTANHIRIQVTQLAASYGAQINFET